MSWYIGDCHVVYGPIGKKVNGEWSKREVILAAFRDHREAVVYLREKKALGIPVQLVTRRETR